MQYIQIRVAALSSRFLTGYVYSYSVFCLCNAGHRGEDLTQAGEAIVFQLRPQEVNMQTNRGQ